eukprot:NODE_679_length_1253_cov_225.042359_g541_i0.p2 GENE.NODE_679_length_1253_cov_225.042359_g541_i0~~NODE_679_length_1253_cov_225.042359_g541_i0.p2  ORF type:complete len:342 (+),score=68.74 NODE_679_length_1253_cov_225.042359_g541_i0:62-1087(+)
MAAVWTGHSLAHASIYHDSPRFIEGSCIAPSVVHEAPAVIRADWDLPVARTYHSSSVLAAPTVCRGPARVVSDVCSPRYVHRHEPALIHAPSVVAPSYVHAEPLVHRHIEPALRTVVHEPVSPTYYHDDVLPPRVIREAPARIIHEAPLVRHAHPVPASRIVHAPSVVADPLYHAPGVIRAEWHGPRVVRRAPLVVDEAMHAYEHARFAPVRTVVEPSFIHAPVRTLIEPPVVHRHAVVEAPVVHHRAPVHHTYVEPSFVHRAPVHTVVDVEPSLLPHHHHHHTIVEPPVVHSVTLPPRRVVAEAPIFDCPRAACGAWEAPVPLARRVVGPRRHRHLSLDW